MELNLVLDIFRQQADLIMTDHQLHNEATLDYTVDDYSYQEAIANKTMIIDTLNNIVKKRGLEFYKHSLDATTLYTLRLCKLSEDEFQIRGHHCFKNGFLDITLKISRLDAMAIEGKIRDSVYNFVLKEMNYHEGAKVDYE